MNQKTYKPVVLAVMDGFGISLEEKANAVALAQKPTLDSLDQNYPFTALQASGIAVGLPWGEAGNSEVGHLTMGSGRIIFHHLPRVISSIRDGTFYENEAFLKAAAHVKERGSKLHLLGLVSSGSVHSYIDHLYALMRFAEQQKIPRVFLHMITDGKDALPKEGQKFLDHMAERMAKEFPHITLADIVGRYYAMDRDEQWERVQKAYDLYTEGKGVKIEGWPSEYIRASYERGVTDEFIEPAYVADSEGKPIGLIEDGDAVIMFNFREDSMREIAHALADEAFDAFPRLSMPNLLVVTMTEYSKDLRAVAAFQPLEINAPLARIIADAGLKQLHIAETEKYAHVTYFFNGGREKPFPNEDRVLIPSLQIAHLDDAPEMKAVEIASKTVEELSRYDFILVNFANTDMIGHSGNIEAGIKAVEIVDRAVGRLMEAVLEKDGVLIVTGDHGNIEAKRDLVTGERLTEHSLNPVPFYLVGRDFKFVKPRSHKEVIAGKREVGGILTDVAPTVLELMGFRKPTEMNGGSLLTSLLKQISAHR